MGTRNAAGLAIAIAAALAGAACRSPVPVPRSAALGEQVTLAPGAEVTVGTLSVTVGLTKQPGLLDRVRDRIPENGGVFVTLREGAHHDNRTVLAHPRLVKFASYVVDLGAATPNGHIAVRVSAWAPASPLSPDDARLVAEEHLSPTCETYVVCDPGVLATDAKTLRVECRSSGVSDSEQTVTVDASTGAVAAVVRRGGA